MLISRTPQEASVSSLHNQDSSRVSGKTTPCIAIWCCRGEGLLGRGLGQNPSLRGPTTEGCVGLVTPEPAGLPQPTATLGVSRLS